MRVQSVFSATRAIPSQVLEKGTQTSSPPVDRIDLGTQQSPRGTGQLYPVINREIRHDRREVSHLLHPHFGARVAAGAGLAGVATAALTGFLSGDWGVATGMGLFTAAALSVIREREQPVHLEPGIHRFDSAESAQQVYQKLTGQEGFQSLWEGPTGADQQRVQDTLGECSNLFNNQKKDYLLVLSSDLGEARQPGLVVLPKHETVYPVQLGDRGLTLPDGVLLAYSSLEAIGEYHYDKNLFANYCP